MVVSSVLWVWLSFAAAWQIEAPDFDRARALSLPAVRDKVAGVAMRAHWDPAERGFWYLDQHFGQSTYRWVALPSGQAKPLFDHAALAAALADVCGEAPAPEDLPLRSVRWVAEHQTLEFNACDGRRRWHPATATLSDLPAARKASTSDNGRWSILPDNGNLRAFDLKNQQAFPLTHDGEPRHAYGWEPSWYAQHEITGEPKTGAKPDGVSLVWSPDQNQFATFRIDRRNAGSLTLFQAAADQGFRPKVWTYERALPVDEKVAAYSLHLFDLNTQKHLPVSLPPTDAYPQWSLPQWSADGKTLWWPRWHRAFRAVELIQIDAATGESRVLRTETSETFVDPMHHQFRVLAERNEIIWSSEADGWHHLFLLDAATGKVKRRLTQGAWMVESVAHVDEEAGWLVFSANGREPGEDPYLRRLYRLNLADGAIRLLTPEKSHHQFQFSPKGGFFIDEQSLVNRAPRYVLRRTADGSVIQELAASDIQPLLEAGWRHPEPFVVKARDGKTDLYGVIYLPADFDPARRYPVIDASYSGPHAVNTPKGFRRLLRRSETGIASLGFVVVNIDGLGTARRGKAFQNVSYRNLGDVGAPDHIGALRQLAKTRPWMDLDRVGIYGHSAGGYDTVRAMLMHPEFYKVGVSSAGNHDHRMAKIWWPELWMGRDGDHYREQSNMTHADKLQGRLLLVHGDMDNNVNPSASLRLAAALIEHDKDFELLLLPNRDHYLEDHPYFIRKRMEWFVRHLQGPALGPTQTMRPDAAR
ncbi:S9 family peptidase [Acanthopleuribacter pedis]|uniref:Prolyl oligopeptidase family serine peptidase n=1 Tax=Acanthopleuribacter pedis TaxID=442870 RepID=A0A8J7QD50_9BACT|nr:prolyl oligopeptidase family serine peptidase [Acanthopleuribacter pedis]MBO1321939.1 prolyl oligopeptidase family serine peptidase [Acanthopleuribacter pedis]